MENTKTHSFLETESIGRLMLKYAVPCIISLLVAALYNIVDQIFIANADYLGSYGNAANTVVFPLTVIALAIAVMIGDGACAYVSISLGKGEYENAHKSVGNAIVICLAAGLACMAAYLLFADPLLKMFGGGVNEKTMLFSREYLFWITLGIPFYMLGQALNPIIRSDGSPVFAMVSTLLGAVINIILDPVFIFIFKWGMMGAAAATVIGQLATAILSVWYLFRTKAIKLSSESFKPCGKIIRETLSLGICSFLAQISLVAAMAATNNMLKVYSAADAVFGNAEFSQIPMAVLGIVMKVFQIVIAVSIGMAAGCIPIVGYNSGCRRADRVRNLLTRLLSAEFAVGLAALLAVEFLPKAIINIFGAANESIHYTAFAVRTFRIYLCMLPLATVNKAAFIFLQSLGKPWESAFLSMLREVVLGVGFVLLLPLRFRLDGVLFSMPAADLLTFAISAVLISKIYIKLSKQQKAFMAQ